jgi:hypothetical protein
MPPANLMVVATGASACQDLKAMESSTAMVSSLVLTTRGSTTQDSKLGTTYD